MATNRRTCKLCGQPDDLVGPISRKGMCLPCGEERYLANLNQQRLKTGPFYEKQQRAWRSSLAPYGRPETTYPPDA